MPGKLAASTNPSSRKFRLREVEFLTFPAKRCDLDITFVLLARHLAVGDDIGSRLGSTGSSGACSLGLGRAVRSARFVLRLRLLRRILRIRPVRHRLHALRGRIAVCRRIFPRIRLLRWLPRQLLRQLLWRRLLRRTLSRRKLQCESRGAVVRSRSRQRSALLAKSIKFPIERRRRLRQSSRRYVGSQLEAPHHARPATAHVAPFHRSRWIR